MICTNTTCQVALRILILERTKKVLFIMLVCFSDVGKCIMVVPYASKLCGMYLFANCCSAIVCTWKPPDTFSMLRPCLTIRMVVGTTVTAVVKRHNFGLHTNCTMLP